MIMPIDKKTPQIAVQDLSEQDLRTLQERGYTLIKELGANEGATRRAYDARRKVGNLDLEGVLKIPKPEEEITSLNALINRSKKNLELQEALINGQLRHPGIARTSDSFPLADKRTCNYEDRIDGWSITSLLKKTGPITDISRVKQIFTPVIDALAFCHNGEFKKDSPYRNGILHRDITPNNIIIPEAEAVGGVITDWQNAAFERDIDNLSVPTRGGTAYTHPVLLNSLISGNLARATRRMDVYSLGATLYETLTGEKAFHYNVVEDSNGKEINVGDKIFRLGLKDGEEEVQEITAERHQANVNGARKVMKAKKLPRKLVNLVSDMLTLDDKSAVYDMATVQQRFLEATETTKQEVTRNLGRYVKTALITAGACIGLGLATYFGVGLSNMPESARGPTLADIMASQNRFGAISRGNLIEAEDIQHYKKDNFRKYLDEAKSRSTEIEGRAFEKDLARVAEGAGILADKKLVSGLIRSILLEKDRNEIAGTNRYPYVLVPKVYVNASNKPGEIFEENNDTDELRQKIFMGRYIQAKFNIGDSVEDIYTKALCDGREIDIAKANTLKDNLIKNLRDKGFRGPEGALIPIGEIFASYPVTNIGYFAREEIKVDRQFGKDISRPTYIPGYSDHLDPIKRRIIDRAVALYLITDDNGKLDFKKYDEPYSNHRAKPTRGEEAK